MSRGDKRPRDKEKYKKEGRYAEAARKDHSVFLSGAARAGCHRGGRASALLYKVLQRTDN
jgi:hypothetical protein